MTSFDVLVVGAGSAGAVVAARLSEDPTCSVALVEAGGMPEDPDIADPRQWPFLQGRSYDWAFATLPQAGTAGRVHPWPRGRLLGGSSCLHAMAHVRGHPDDFAPWAEAGGLRWSYEGLLPGFRRSEAFSRGPSAQRGGEGPLPVLLPDEGQLNPVVRTYMAAGLALGAPWLGDHNSGGLAGVAPNQLTIRDGRRVSLADAYLTPSCLARPNITLLVDTLVERLLIERGRVEGLLVQRGGGVEVLRAASYVLCAGAVASPLLLLRSGVGDPAELRAAGVDCRLALPEVGRNLHDHLLAGGNLYAAKLPVPPSKLQHSESLLYLHGGDRGRRDGSPDLVLACVTLPVVTERFARPASGSAYTLLCGFTHPTSRGTVRLGGPAAADPPRIDPAYLATEVDRCAFRDSLRLAREVGHAAPFDDWRAAELLPDPALRSDADLDTFLAEAAMTHHHPVGTCRLGPPGEGVVSPDLRIHGLDNAWIVDASIIPVIPSGPVNAAVVAIAETWAETCRPG